MVKEEFPILSQSVNEKPLIYLDNASTTQKPSSVISEIQNYYQWWCNQSIKLILNGYFKAWFWFI